MTLYAPCMDTPCLVCPYVIELWAEREKDLGIPKLYHQNTYILLQEVLLKWVTQA